MPVPQLVALNTFTRWAGELIVKLVWFVFFILIARFLGDERFGYFTYALALSSFFVTFTDLGTNTFAVKIISQSAEKANSVISDILSIKFVLSLLVLAVFAVVAWLNVQTREYYLFILLICLALTISAFLDVYNSYYRGISKMYYETGLMIVWRLLLAVIGTVALYVLNAGMYGLAVALVAGAVIACIFAVVFTASKLGLRLIKPEFRNWYGIIVSAFPLGVIMILGAAYFKLNVVLLGWLRHATEVGWYGAAFRFVEGLMFMPSVFMAAVLPFIIKYFAGEQEKYSRAFTKSLLFMLSVALPMAVGMFLLSKQIILVFYGVKFVNAHIALQIMAGILFVFFMNELALYYLISANNEKLVVRNMLICAGVYLPSCFVMISLWGYLGAAAALLGAQIVLLIMNYVLLSKNVKITIDKKQITGILWAILIMFFVVRLLQLSGVHVLINVGISSIAYFGMIYFFKVFENEVKMLTELLWKKLV
ncbi:MAG: oligosaccharide flippase family protein [Elusimicrobiota bacterium]